MSNEMASSIRPRIIIHGGAGNIRRDNLPKLSYEAYKASLLSVLRSASNLLTRPDATALNVATHAVALLEDNSLFNCGKGAVFTRAGTTELEASIMVSNGYCKKGVGCMMLKRVKNPIKLAREMLVKGEYSDGGGAQGHSQLSGEGLEELAEKWGLELVEQGYFFTQRRWDEHIRGLQSEKEYREGLSHDFVTPVWLCEGVDGGPSWDGREYLPQGTVGAVVLDRFGTICVATSTGGLTNKLPGRIGDTPTLGAGFWAEEWVEEVSWSPQMIYKPHMHSKPDMMDSLSRGNVSRLISICLPVTGTTVTTESQTASYMEMKQVRHVVGMSGTGNGDSFLRTNAVRTAAAISRFSMPNTSLAEAVRRMAGPGGELQESAGSRWGKTGEGEGGIIGIELVGAVAHVVFDFNCGGMFRAWIDDNGEYRFMVFRDEY